ncbi:hypothetical protein ACHAW5_001924 [Stephanodiscus triporus]|uniref:Uncharacterized protein n=1 Tax=Stephanodiscus triporus TaxID=2934178 RepID=A0ABD3NRR3_9STRA
MTSPSFACRLAHAASLASRPALASMGIITFRPSMSTSSSQSRPLSTSSNKGGGGGKNNVTDSAADRRLAGRRRFYADVGIAPTSPPSSSSPPNPPLSNKTEKRETADAVIDLPISAGVDGTRSAMGVVSAVSDSSVWTEMLNPVVASTAPIRHRRRPRSDGTPSPSTADPCAPPRTPPRLPSVPLAMAVASEWDAQGTHLRPAQMPLMMLCCTAIDQVASQPTSRRDGVMGYLRNDTTCYWADTNVTGDRALRRRQSTAWNRLHGSTTSGALGLPVGHDLRPASSGLRRRGREALSLGRRSTSNPTSGLPHPPLLVSRARRWVDSLDAWTLAALYSACAESKSFFVGVALIHEATTATTATDNVVVRDGRWAVGAARVEEEFNIECWGLVEGGHDYDRLNCSIQMHAASFLARTVAYSCY